MKRSKMIVTSLIAIILVLVLVKYIMHMLRIESYVKNLPMGLPFIPIFGNVLSFIGKPHEKIFEKALEIIKTNGTPLKAYLGPILVIAVDSPEDCKTLLTSPHCLDKPCVFEPNFSINFKKKIDRLIFSLDTSTNSIRIRLVFWPYHVSLIRNFS